MLYDIMPIPMRYEKGDTISTLLPLFNYDSDAQTDNINWLGTEIPIDDDICKNIFKYKTIELINDRTIERMFFTTEEIDFKKSWWTSDMKIYPVYARSWSHVDQNSIMINRYVNGIHEMLGEIAQTPCNVCTIEEKAKDIVKKVIPIAKEKEQQELINGDDYSNVNMLSTAIDIYNNRRYLSRNSIEELQKFFKSIPTIEKNFDDDRYIDPAVKLCSLKTIKKQDFGIPMCSVIPTFINPLFESMEDVCYGEDNMDLKSQFLDICNKIEFLGCTDFGLKISYDALNDINVWVEAYSRYMGYSDRLTKNKLFMKQVDYIVNLLSKWFFKKVILNSKARPIGIKVQKSWTDEIFIEALYFENNKEKYYRCYIDLAMYCLGTISLCDKYN